MKKVLIAIATVLTLASCSTYKRATTDEQRNYVSWIAFCANRGYNINDHTYKSTNEYFDTWC